MVCKVTRTSCCFLNFACHTKPLVLLFIFLQVTLLIVIVLYLRGYVGLLSPLNYAAPQPEKYKNYVIVNENEVFKLIDTQIEYFRTEKSVNCLITGTKSWGFTKCECNRHWNGDDCGIPDAVWHLGKRFSLQRRAKPRRLIYAFPVNRSIDLVEIRIEELRDVVDVFIISERNGSSQDITVLSQLSNGWLSDYADHLLYIRNANKQPMDTDLLIHQILHHLNDVRPDDFVIFTSFNEIPFESILICLKLYDGFPEMFSLYFQQIVNGFYNVKSTYASLGNTNFPPTVSTIHFLLHDCDGQSSCLYRKISENIIGSAEHPTGWKCNECNNEIQGLNANGDYNLTNTEIIPKYVLAHRAKFNYLLNPTSESKTNVTKVSDDNA